MLEELCDRLLYKCVTYNFRKGLKYCRRTERNLFLTSGRKTCRQLTISDVLNVVFLFFQLDDHLSARSRASVFIAKIQDLDMLEDPRTPTLRRVSYGIVMPAICCLGIIGNILNLVVLTRRNMRGTAYIYMRGEYRLSVYHYLFLHCKTYNFTSL